MRCTKAGFVLRDKRLKYFIPLHLNHKDEILNGSPVTRCFGEQRFKSNPKLPIEKQGILFTPEVTVYESWKQGDFMFLGSSGFWDMCRNSSKMLLADCVLYRYDQVRNIRREERLNEDKKKVNEYDNSLRLVNDTLLNVFDEGFGIQPPVDGKPPKIDKDLPPVGYENITAFHIRLTDKPHEFKGEVYGHKSDSD